MNNSAKEKKRYEAPQLTVVSFKVERGYAASNQLFTLGLLLGSIPEDYGMQDYNLQNNQNWNL